jgi:hypothetical protein
MNNNDLKEQLKIAGCGAFEDETGIVEGSQGFFANIAMVPTNANKLAEKSFQKQQAQRFYDWMSQNLPAGIYDQLFKLMTDNNKSMRENMTREKWWAQENPELAKILAEKNKEIEELKERCQK